MTWPRSRRAPSCSLGVRHRPTTTVIAPHRSRVHRAVRPVPPSLQRRNPANRADLAATHRCGGVGARRRRGGTGSPWTTPVPARSRCTRHAPAKRSGRRLRSAAPHRCRPRFSRPLPGTPMRSASGTTPWAWSDGSRCPGTTTHRLRGCASAAPPPISTSPESASPRRGAPTGSPSTMQATRCTLRPRPAWPSTTALHRACSAIAAPLPASTARRGCSGMSRPGR